MFTSITSKFNDMLKFICLGRNNNRRGIKRHYDDSDSNESFDQTIGNFEAGTPQFRSPTESFTIPNENSDVVRNDFFELKKTEQAHHDTGFTEESIEPESSECECDNFG